MDSVAGEIGEFHPIIMIKNNLPHCHSADLAMEVDEAMDGDGQDEDMILVIYFIS